MLQSINLFIGYFLVLSYSQSCTLVVPIKPLTASGLATPYLYKNCQQELTSSFVEALIYNQRTHTFRIYTPLVVNFYLPIPLVPTLIPSLIDGDIVGIWFGSNANELILENAFGTTSLQDGFCVNGVLNSPFGQVSACNAVKFFQIVNKDIASRLLKIPSAGLGLNKKSCYTTRSFEVVDQDQSDNVVSTYLQQNGKFAQYSINNQNLFKNATILKNGSDNRLLNNFILPAFGCTGYLAPDIINGGVMRGAQALDEIFAAANQNAPVAIVPFNNPMTQVNGTAHTVKLNLYRAIVNQPQFISSKSNDIKDNEVAYCKNILNVGLISILANRAFTIGKMSPTSGTDLYTFLLNRMIASLIELKCDVLLY